MWPAVINCLQTNIISYIWSNCLSIIQTSWIFNLIWYNYIKIRNLLSIALFNILRTHYLIHIWEKIVKEIIQIIKNTKTLDPLFYYINCNKNKNIYYSNQWAHNRGKQLHTLIIVIGGNYTNIYKYNVSCRVQSLKK
jgi:hypothetical protein